MADFKLIACGALIGGCVAQAAKTMYDTIGHESSAHESNNNFFLQKWPHIALYSSLSNPLYRLVYFEEGWPVAVNNILQCFENLANLYTIVINTEQLQRTIKMCAMHKFQQLNVRTSLHENALNQYEKACAKEWYDKIVEYDNSIIEAIDQYINESIPDFLTIKTIQRNAALDQDEKQLNHDRKNGSLEWISSSTVRAFAESVLDTIDNSTALRNARTGANASVQREPHLANWVRKKLRKNQGTQQITIPPQVPTLRDWLEIRMEITRLKDILIESIKNKLL